MKSLLTTTLLLAWAGTAFSDASFYSEQYHTVRKAQLYEIVTDAEGNEKEVLLKGTKIPNAFEEMLQNGAKLQEKSQGVGEVLMMTTDLIALGKEIYKIIEAGQPVVNVESTPVSVLPRDEKGAAVDAFALTRWSAPSVKKFKVVFSNYLGMTPVSFEFMSIYSYGGKYQDKGFYITGAQIKPTKVDVSWGYNIDATFSVQSITNMGSTEDPVAAAVLMIDYKVKTLVKESRNSKSFFINGLGHTQALQ